MTNYKKPVSKIVGMENEVTTDITEILEQEHDEVKELFEQFQVEIEGNKRKAGALLNKIVSELEGHTKREEKLVYPHLKELDEDLFFEAHEEHHVADLLIAEIKKLSINDDFLPAKVKVLEENIKHHIEEEQGEMFEQLRTLDESELAEMAEEWRAAKTSRKY